MSMAAVPKAKREQFFEAFGKYVECLATMEAPKVSQGVVPFESLRALLICTHLDTLAKARYGGRSSGERFRRLLEREAGQDAIYQLVALERLLDRLHRTNADPRAIEAVKALTKERWRQEIIIRVFDGSEVDVASDVIADRLRAARLAVAPESPLANALGIERYSSIVWRDYRCGLVHETRVLNSGFNLTPNEDREPFYVTHIEGGAEIPKLIIPTRFLLRTLCCALDLYRQHCNRSDLDPYDKLGIP